MHSTVVKMKTFLFIFFMVYAVRCEDDAYLIRFYGSSESRDFKVYWNVPTIQCQSKKISFDGLFDEYGIIQNTGDTYRGDKIAILYDPGNFPALIKNVSTGEIRYRNGGVPQEGSLIDHLQKFKTEIEKSIPDKNFSGLAIIDFESWRPILRQNFGSLTPYKDVSFKIERERHWWWKRQWTETEAIRRFESAGREFMEKTITLAKKMRPEALWGYYGYPQCFNRAFNSRPEECADAIPAENNKIHWLWMESRALFPSVYSSKDVKAERLVAFIRGRITESERVREKGTPIIPYWWFRYRDGGYFKKEDLETSFNTFYNTNVSGFIIWGSSKDVNTVTKCIDLRKYVTDILGPTVAKYIKGTRSIVDEELRTEAPAVMTTKDPYDPIAVQTNTTERTTTEQTTCNHQSFSSDDKASVTNVQMNDTADNDAENTSIEIESNEYTTVSILENDTNTTDLTTSIETYTDNPSDTESSEDTSITNLSNNYSEAETSTHSIDIERPSTLPSTQETSTNATNYNLVSNNIPKLNLNDTSLTNFNATTNAHNFSSNIISTDNYSLDSVSTTNVLNDTSPMNESSTEFTPGTVSRPVPIYWNIVNKNLLTLSNFVKAKFGAIDGSGGRATTKAPELEDQVVVSVV